MLARRSMVPVSRFLADISVQTRNGARVSDPANAILAYVRENPESQQSIATIKASLAIIDCWGAIHTSDIRALSDNAVVLLNEFAIARLRLQYSVEELSRFAAKLEHCLTTGRLRR